VAEPGAGIGRPRDPLLDARVRAAAREVYGRLGWAGFSIETVARKARVGKSSIYLRWPDTTALLLDMLESTVGLSLDTDTGSVRGDLLVLARNIMDLLIGEDGDTILRLSTEARMIPELAPHWEQFVQVNVAAVRKIVRRAVARGELPAGTAGNLLLNALVGGLMMQCLTTPPSRRARLAKDAKRYTESLVELVLASTVSIALD
jgi:AcrR family transcriptional regulator